MEQKDRWTVKFRDRMEGYTETPPADIWEKLDEELAFGTTQKRNRQFFFRIAVAAAVLLLPLIGLYFFVFTPESEVPVAKTSADKILLHEDNNEVSSKVSSETTPIYNRKIADARVGNLKVKEIPDLQQPVDVAKEEEMTEPPVDNIESLPETKEKKLSESESKSVLQKDESHSLRNMPVHRDFEVKDRNEKKRGWSIGVSVGNSMMTSAENHYGFSNLDRSGATSRGLNLLQAENSEKVENYRTELAYQQIMFKNINTETSTSVKHHFPITFGVSLRKDISNRFSLETGLVYTLLSSDLKAGGDVYYFQEQKLHYLGIPLKAGCYLVKKKYLSLYLSAGGMIEKCVKSQLQTHYEMQNDLSFVGDEHLDVDRLQGSILASLGAQFNITDYLGLYAEPGVVYYFDDGTDVATIRKEKPFNVNLQIGLRFGF